MQKNILAISGSLRQGSANELLLRHIRSRMEQTVDYIIYGELAAIPPFDPGLDTDNPPAAVTALRAAISNADAVVICTPEYAFGVPGQLKNALDWMVSSSTLVNKPVALITASLGGDHAHASLQLTLGALSASLINDGVLLISFIRSKIDAKGAITDQETKVSIERLCNVVLAAIR